MDRLNIESRINVRNTIMQRERKKQRNTQTEGYNDSFTDVEFHTVSIAPIIIIIIIIIIITK
jgi:hypothetical protein